MTFSNMKSGVPPIFSSACNLRSGTKADLLGCLESNCAAVRGEAPGADVIILAGALVVNFLKPHATTTFDDYAMKIFLPHVQAQLQHASMVGVVWDQYRREKCGKGVCRRLHQSPRKLASVSATVLADRNDRVVYPHGNREASI